MASVARWGEEKEQEAMASSQEPLKESTPCIYSKQVMKQHQLFKVDKKPNACFLLGCQERYKKYG